jgi:Ca-activated chloride channel family protein
MKRASLAAAAGLVLLVVLSPTRAQERGPIRVDVNLVSVIVNALDAGGRPLANLSLGDFTLFEEGRPQKVEIFEAETQQPLDLALMVDTSLSTLKELHFEQAAASRFIGQVLRPGDRIAVYQFSDVVTQLRDFSGDAGVLRSAVQQMEAGAGTAMYDAVYLAARALERRPGGRRRVILLVTDAGETTSSTTYEDARRAALQAEAMLYTILIRPVKSESGRNTAGEHALLTIAEVTGGAMYYPSSVEALPGIFDRIDRELRTQYRLGYYPQPRPPERSYRRIELRVRGCGEAPRETAEAKAAGQCLLRYRRGYFTSGATE